MKLKPSARLTVASVESHQRGTNNREKRSRVVRHIISIGDYKTSSTTFRVSIEVALWSLWLAVQLSPKPYQRSPLPPHLMPPAKIALDGLWRCLCPSYTVSSFAISSISKPGSRKASSLCLNTVLLNSSRRHRTTTFTNAIPLKSLQPRIPPYSNEQVRQLHDDPNQPYEATVLRKLPKSDVYEELHSASIQGNYVRVQEIVEILVKDRNEAPNKRIYLALLLANASPQHGSPTEVVRLLQEMAKEGITPDAGAYHAVLKVSFLFNRL